MKQRRRRWTTYSGRGKRVAARTHTARDKAAAAPRMLLQLIVCGGEDRTTVTALFDNLGKGASGAAVQNMNLMLGFDEVAGLAL